ncbi:MAG: DNA topoisomerase IV subunit A [Gammaproteobacteria bacterium]|jgi:topoisomerase-4 subunit A|uniref:DNA topoisomerase IV subunit A n=1 Tax=Hydrogenophaga sp. TaxID=1904254 RepID=UPI000CC12D53|nr:DNA topoisomerase IV subunit A [Hydrogenophaga sp.]MBU4180802.1 DNA topoisomerase IV subunit A [Gammaproteobacteria bacterium]PKO77036.1 MAG: DNA topoisomerase IV subunit A [Betaproteobacteria bacterium HGW-Betaproteobacteria-15]MBU4282365.1 DNA topoisomerase IV subunit A [Gammaproteobacteria bacterium]MBU4506213.1 DNA topoisomerase IV subunit A [Gammaproteobacteria bacterium]MCG2656894.1 DNA topoisomerase IV subunit A [Hydrogenophaga sp.]
MDTLTPELPLGLPGEPEADNLATYAQRAYLEYALSVVKGRALPDVCDGQKPVQRRILYAMDRMGLGYSGNTAAKPVKSARVVGDVLGKYHPHGDSAAYDALVRMAQDFSQRYPLIDGQGNFGSRDGDGAAAMRYTEARLAKITGLLLDEIDQGTVDFIPTYDGSFEEPKQLPARLPFNLLNGASGIAVGLATEIPSHNLREVADACVALIKTPKLSDEELFAIIPGPDYPGGGQIISPAGDIADAYRSGRGSLKVRARWKIEDLARGQWQLVVNELPPGVSTQRVLEEIEEITNPKVKAGKKALSQEQTQLKASMLMVLDVVRDESSKDAPVRLVFEPKSSRIEQSELITALLAHTSLESSSPINLTMIGLDGRPTQKSLRLMLSEWIEFRQGTITRRTQHRLNKVLDRIHILEGRQLVLLNIDEVIRIIRHSDEPKPALIAAFKLSDRQAEDILEIRLRQLARLEAIKIEQELKDLREEQGKLEDILGNPASLKRLMVKEIEADAKTFADPRRTLIQAEKKAVAEIKVVDEPVTVVISSKGWVRARTGHGHEAGSFAFKAGDGLYGTFECRTVDLLIVFGSNGRVYSVPVASLPGARGDGQPITTLIELESGTQPLHYFAGPASATLLLSGTGGYGFLATVENLVSRQRAGKAFISVGEGETICAPSHVANTSGSQPLLPATHVACASTGGRILTFEIAELKAMEKGGRGLMLIDLEAKDTLAGAAAYTRSVKIEGIGRGGKERDETLEIRSLNNARAARARKGKAADLGFKPSRVARVE